MESHPHANTSERYFQLVLVRHGETEHNRLRILQGQSDVPLSDVGIRQAELVAKRLASEVELGQEFDMVFSSDLCRASQTASAIVARMREKKEIVTDKLLREKYFGKFEGRPLSEMIAAAKVAGVRPADFVAKDGEATQRVVARARQFFDKLIKQCYPLLSETSSSSSPLASNDCQPTTSAVETLAMSSKSSLPVACLRVLVVSHGGWIKCMLDHLLTRCPRVAFPRRIALSPNTGVTSLLVGLAEKTSTEAADATEEQDIVCTSVISQCMNDSSHL